MHHPPPLSTTILLHGILSSGIALKPIKKYLEQHHCPAIDISYPSRQFSTDQLAKYVYNTIKLRLAPDEPFNVVAHSLGGILVRVMVHEHPELIANHRLERVVMLGTPNQGSDLAEVLCRKRLGRHLLGPAGKELCPNADLLTKKLGKVSFPLGVIAGNRSHNPFSERIFEGVPNDGAVAVAATKVAGMADWIELPTTHSGLHTDRRSLHQTFYFLSHGHFEHTAPTKNTPRVT